MYKRKEKYKTEEEKREAVMQYAWNILNTHNPSEELIRYAIDRDANIIGFIPNASQELWRYAINRYVVGIGRIPNLSEELKMYAVERYVRNIVEIPNPSQEILDYVYKNHRAIFDGYFEKVES